MSSGTMRRKFFSGVIAGLRVVWPVLSGILVLMVTLGIIVGLLEGWSLGDSLYFTFVSGLTIGYGDLAPKTGVARVLAVLIGMLGILLAGLVAAVAVQALLGAREGPGAKQRALSISRADVTRSSAGRRHARGPPRWHARSQHPRDA
jgi:hypothetical protein